jgi:hypothetical protein
MAFLENVLTTENAAGFVPVSRHLRMVFGQRCKILHDEQENFRAYPQLQGGIC